MHHGVTAGLGVPLGYLFSPEGIDGAVLKQFGAGGYGDTKLSDDSRKYGVENTCTTGNTLSKVALIFGRARSQMEKERGSLLKALGTQVADNGWAEGESRGRAGWFPYGFIERRDRVLASKITYCWVSIHLGYEENENIFHIFVKDYERIAGLIILGNFP
ncbi:hypothetical protein QJS10_CPA01g02299 [Acorus calamus]|uniref:Uncharacterized protein n=1 Tax=Acorus calamus TaxID=4465 RepID=A0AAV9FH34_ACOCL|nr:hypothetical protein QJS10_CPA01g02299 [Acorus calamus]